MPSKKHLRGMTLDELKEVARECGFPGFTAKQIADWIYKKRVRSIDEMSNISVAHRNKLSENYTVGEIPASEKKISGDGTIKYLFPAKTGKFIETVMIPDKDRYTLCVSSQVGCKFNCLFCMTGKQGFNGNLIAHEILNQIFSVEEADKLTNIVFMGMGEPLDNYKEVKKNTRYNHIRLWISLEPEKNNSVDDRNYPGAEKISGRIECSSGRKFTQSVSR